MIDRIIGFGALGGFFIAFLLFLSRMLYIVTPNSRAYSPVIWTFFWVFGGAIILGDIFIVRKLATLTLQWSLSLRWLFNAGAFLGILIGGGVIFLTLCVGMNFVGQ